MSDSDSSDIELQPHMEKPTIEKTKHFAAVVEYDADAVSSFKVFCFFVGTVLEQRILWCEMLVYAVAWLTGFMINVIATNVLGIKEIEDEVWKPALNAAGRTSLVVTLLLGFHTSTTYSRWWRLRTEGIGAMWAASSATTMLLSQFTQDAQILESISRYARASLCLIAIKRRFRADASSHLNWLEEDGILTEEEVDKLRSWNNNLAESIWTWNAEIVTSLYHEGVIQTDLLYEFLMTHVLKGRGGAALVCAQCNTALPLPYVHVLSLMVKVYSACISAVHGANFYGDGNFLSPVFIVEPFLICFLFNAMLIINNTLCDPFDGNLNDFPIHHYQQGFASDAKSYVDAGRNLPNWLAARKRKVHSSMPGSGGTVLYRREVRAAGSHTFRRRRPHHVV